MDDTSRLYRLVARIGPNFVIAIAFTLALFGVITLYGGSVRWKEGPILWSAGITVGIMALRTIWGLPAILRGRPGAGRDLREALMRTLHDWGPLIIVMWTFESLEPYTGIIRKTVFDQQLYEFDLNTFGVEPTVWIGRYSNPFLTDYFSICYGLYFILPMFLATALSIRGRRADFLEMVTAVVIQMGIGFMTHLFLPAGPPRHFKPLLDGGFDPPTLRSYTGLMELQQGAFDTADPLKTHSAFPSLHCSLGILTLLFAYRYGSAVSSRHPRWFARVITVIVVSLWISTIYLRHHWVLDCLAGLALGAISTALAAVVRRHWPRPRGTARTSFAL